VDPVLILWRYVLVVVEGRSLLDHVLIRRDLDELPPFVYANHLHRNQSGLLL
jgi:hypothetical protein